LTSRGAPWRARAPTPELRRRRRGASPSSLPLRFAQQVTETCGLVDWYFQVAHTCHCNLGPSLGSGTLQ
jgi:hypothetical protein